MRVSVIGGGTITDEAYDTAEEVGRLLGARGDELVCGGRGGVMEAACEGADAAGGRSIGLLRTENPADANEYVDTAIATGMGNARNVVVVMNGDAVIAVSGSTGTLSEIGHALDFGRPVAGLDTHRVDDVPGIEHVDSSEDAVEYVENSLSD